VDLGRCDPARFYAAAQAVAEGAAPGDPATVLWALPARAHLCLGASQGLEAADPAGCREAGLDVLRRPVGGGAVLVDAEQPCFLIVLPGESRRERVLGRCLGAARDVLARWGLHARCRPPCDLLVGGRKILGSGAATVGASAVFGASFLRRFDAARFAAAVPAPSTGFRRWLRDALACHMIDLAQALGGEPPGPSRLGAALREALARRWGWRLEAAPLAACCDGAALAEAAAELAVEAGTPVARDEAGPWTIKVREGVHLVEHGRDGRRLRLLVAHGHVRRAAASSPAAARVLRRARVPLRDGRQLEAALARAGVDEARAWRLLVEAAAARLRPAPRVTAGGE